MIDCYVVFRRQVLPGTVPGTGTYWLVLFDTVLAIHD